MPTRACLLIVFLTAGTTSAADSVDFNRDVRPILSNKCFACHGPDEASVEGGLQLDRFKTATQELDSGLKAIVPGKPDQSELIARITTDDEDLRMPPADHGAKLSPEEINVLKRWVAEGANYALHWSYQQPQRPAIPDVSADQKHWPRNAIDHFVLNRMQQQGLQPAAEADRYALVRRVFLDLIGLPPTVQQADEFVHSDDPLAYEKLVDQLLADSAFGEHWARKWLDLARYADSAGYADDPPRTIWAYRDWVIQSYNDNMPFDQFTIEQMAGDLLPDASDSQLVATAFHRNTLTNNEGGTQDEEFRNVAVVDRVNTTMAVWMGTTMACAQCHTHKYDPITQEEYFRFFAVLNNTQDNDRKDESPTLSLFTPAQKVRQAELREQVKRLNAVLAHQTPELTESQLKWEQSLKTPADWDVLVPQIVTRQSSLPILVTDADVIRADQAAATDTYTIEVEFGTDGRPLSAVRVATRPAQDLPGAGAGLANGNFVITGVDASVVPSENSPPTARYIRITNHGKQKILSLAEVEVFSGGQNVATTGTARQQSTGSGGTADRAIDGNTDGNYQKNSVTHTATTTDPWWEVDLKTSVPVEQIKLWNRTDNNLQHRLQGFSVQLLDEKRNEVWTNLVKDVPDPSVSLTPSGERRIHWQQAFADYHQPNFEPTDVISGATGNEDGWAVGGSVTEPHELVLVPAKPIDVSGATLKLQIQQQSSHQNHLLGQFQLSSTADAAVLDRARIPADLLAVLDLPADQRTPPQQQQLADFYRREVAPELQDERRQLAAANTELATMKPATSVPVLREMNQPRETRLQFRGNYLDKGQVVQPGVPDVFHDADDSDFNRLQLAHWLISPNNPLTARVLVNRYWETIFGRGIVVTSEEFGSQGELPTHPLLLDWLATEVVANGWDRKALLRLLVTSSTYRQSARASAEQIAQDPDNRWLSRGPRVRHSAEMIRDQALFVSGLLSRRMYGPPVKPPQPNLGLTAAFGSSTDWKTSEGEDRYRRGLYTTWRRSNPYPSMATFDAPNREVCTVRRNRTNTPLQSLVTLNDPVYVEAAQALGRLALKTDGNLQQKIEAAFRRCLIRPPTQQELSALTSLYDDSVHRLKDQPEEAMQLATNPIGELPAGISAVDAAAMTVVGNVLLNLDEMFLKR